MNHQFLALTLTAIGIGALIGTFPRILPELQLIVTASFLLVSLSPLVSPATGHWLFRPAARLPDIRWDRFWVSVMLVAALLWMLWRGVRLLWRNMSRRCHPLIM